MKGRPDRGESAGRSKNEVEVNAATLHDPGPNGLPEPDELDSLSSFVPSEREIGKGKQIGTQRFDMTPLSGLVTEPIDNDEWLVADLLPVGGTSLLAAKPKVGKTTLARQLVLSVSRGDPFLGRSTVQAPAGYFGFEEKRSRVAEHFRMMGGTDEDVHVYVGTAPLNPVHALATAIESLQLRLAVLDPIQRFIRLRDGNDYTEVTLALESVVALGRNSGCHILFTHHLTKSDRPGADSVLGSTAIFGAVDTAMIYRESSGHRTLSSRQRYGEDMPETTIILDPGTGLSSQGGPAIPPRRDDIITAILDQMGTNRMTAAQIASRVRRSRTAVDRALDTLTASGQLEASGKGVKGSPIRFRIPIPISHTVGEENENEIVQLLTQMM
jgi:hypothetical protein